jgi:hypothetical protein
LTRHSILASRLLDSLDPNSLSEALRQGLRDLSAQGASADLLVSVDRTLVLVLIGGRRNPLVGPARDAALTLLGKDAHTGLSVGRPSLAARLGVAFDPVQAARAATVSTQVQESRSHLASGDKPVAESPADSLATEMDAPLMQGQDLDGVADNLARAVASSGIFLEAHLAQWLRGERSSRQIVQEVNEWPSDLHGEAGELGERRSAVQLDALRRQALTLVGQAWIGQPLRFRIERDLERHREAANLGDATGLFRATLTMHLPRLGMLCVHIRVTEHTLGVRIESERATELVSQLALLARSFAARGLALAELGVVAIETGAPR